MVFSCTHLANAQMNVSPSIFHQFSSNFRARRLKPLLSQSSYSLSLSHHLYISLSHCFRLLTKGGDGLGEALIPCRENSSLYYSENQHTKRCTQAENALRTHSRDWCTCQPYTHTWAGIHPHRLRWLSHNTSPNIGATHDTLQTCKHSLWSNIKILQIQIKHRSAMKIKAF